MNATERLRAMLDERGVPWRGYGYENHTWWGAWHAENRPSINGLFLKVEGVVTPERAIAATLGRGTCKEVKIDRYWRGCGECGYIWEHMYAVGFQVGPRFCPNCGRRIVEVDE